MQHKARAGALLKATDQGQVSVLFAMLKTIDHDNDVTLPGAFTDGQQVRISAYNHASWEPGALPVGKGSIHEDGDNAIFDGQFFLNTTAGKDTFETVKQMGDLQEWSYGYDVLDGAPGQWDGKSVNLLKKINVFEVSPVLLGAGIGTQTLSAKARRSTLTEAELKRLEERVAERDEGIRAEMQTITASTLLRDTQWQRLRRLIP